MPSVHLTGRDKQALPPGCHLFERAILQGRSRYAISPFTACYLPWWLVYLLKADGRVASTLGAVQLSPLIVSQLVLPLLYLLLEVRYLIVHFAD